MSHRWSALSRARCLHLQLLRAAQYRLENRSWSWKRRTLPAALWASAPMSCTLREPISRGACCVAENYYLRGRDQYSQWSCVFLSTTHLQSRRPIPPAQFCLRGAGSIRHRHAHRTHLHERLVSRTKFPGQLKRGYIRTTMRISPGRAWRSPGCAMDCWDCLSSDHSRKFTGRDRRSSRNGLAQVRRTWRARAAISCDSTNVTIGDRTDGRAYYKRSQNPVANRARTTLWSGLQGC